ncbi:MAG: hypothetical protein GY771_11050 [bacterium]|nr:hypothetical protein [bacterium]
MKTGILENTFSAFARSWRLYLLYLLIYAPFLILSQIMSAFTAGQPTADPETALALLAIYCCLILVLLVYLIALLAAIPFYTAGFAGSLREAFFERPVTLRATWQTGKREYGRSFGLFGLYVAATIPFALIFAIAIFVLYGTGGITETEMISGDYLYGNPYVLVALFIFSLSTTVASIWLYSANCALAAKAGKFKTAAAAPFGITARYPEYMIPFILVYLIYSLLMFAANILLPSLVPYSEWGILAVNLLIAPAIHLLILSFLIAAAEGHFTGENNDIITEQPNSGG